MVIYQENLRWSFCVGICTGVAAAMNGRLFGLIFRIKEVAPESESTHCIIHREMLASRKMSPELNSVLTDVKVINYIKAHALNSRLLQQLCEEMHTEHRRLLLHSEIRWLLRGKSLTRVFETTRAIAKIFFIKKVIFGSTFQRQGMSCNTCLFVGHIQPAQ